MPGFAKFDSLELTQSCWDRQLSTRRQDSPFHKRLSYNPL